MQFSVKYFGSFIKSWKGYSVGEHKVNSINLTNNKVNENITKVFNYVKIYWPNLNHILIVSLLCKGIFYSEQKI